MADRNLSDLPVYARTEPSIKNLPSISEQVGSIIRPYVIPFVIILAIVIPINLVFQSTPGLLCSCWSRGGGFESASSLPYQPAASLAYQPAAPPPDQPAASLAYQPAAPPPNQPAAHPPDQPPIPGWAQALFLGMSGNDAAIICRAEENYWENLLLRREASNGTLYPPPASMTNITMKTLLLIPTYSCPVNERIGKWGDGGKWTCLLPGAIQTDPVVYSIGSFGQYDFEDAIYKILHVQPHTFDPFLHPSTAAHMQTVPSLIFHPIGLSANSSIEYNRQKFSGAEFMTLGGIMQLLNHTYVDIFKIDCEGCEEAMIAEFGEANGNVSAQLSLHGGTLPFGQILIEIHQTNKPVVTLALVYTLEKLGYRMFSVEFNHECWHCCELSLIHESLVQPSSDKNCPPSLASEEFFKKEAADAQEKLGSGDDVKESGGGVLSTSDASTPGP